MRSGTTDEAGLIPLTFESPNSIACGQPEFGERARSTDLLLGPTQWRRLM